MDCQTAIKYINLYADSMLGKNETELLLSHISSCAKCKKELEDVIVIKKALARLTEIEPPAGLALSAIRKAKKRRTPIFAYASAGVAAVIALIAVFSSGMFNNDSYDMGMEKVARASYPQPMVAEAEMQEASASKTPASNFALAPQATPAATSAPQATNESVEYAMDSAPREVSVPSITVPADLSESFRVALEEFLNENGITSEHHVNGNDETVSFTITEDKLEDLNSLIDKWLIQYDGELTAGTIRFILEK